VAKVRLIDAIDRTYVIAYKEDTTNLENTLRKAGFGHEVYRAKYSEVEAGYSGQIKCLISHAKIWEKCKEEEGWSMVLEADFVPVKGMSTLCAPIGRLDEPGLVYLYSGAPIIYRVDKTGSLIGHSATTVAYMLDQVTASALYEFYLQDMDVEDPGAYRAWDTYLANWLRWEKGIPTYIAYKQFGEHGGIANREHKVSNTRSWHRADVLYASPEFIPAYAKGSRGRYIFERTLSRVRGLFRLAVCKTIQIETIKNSDDRFRLIGIALRRLF